MSHSHAAAARISRSTFAWILILIFLLLALSVSIGGYFYYLSVRKVVKDRACQRLSAVANLRAGQIDAWRKEMVHDAEVIRSNAYFVEHIGDPADPMVRSFLATVKQQHGYGSITPLNPDGSVILAVGAQIGIHDPEGADLALRAARSDSILIFDFRKEKVAGGTGKVLFVDNEPQIATMAKQHLERLGYRVEVRTDSREALDVFRQRPADFDLVITDMTMPHLTGDKLAREMIKISAGIAIILCTGFSRGLSTRHMSLIGIKAPAMKPLVKDELARLVRKVLDGN